MVTADAAAASGSDTRRLVEVLAGQAAQVLSRLRLVAEVNSEKEMLARVLHHSPVGIVLEDEAGLVVFANPEVERIYGAAAESLPGSPARDLQRRADAFVVIDPEAEPGGAVELRLRDREREVVVQIRRVPIPGTGGQPPRVLTLHEDVTSQRAIMEAKDLTLRAIGHELRSPAAQMRSTLASLMQWGTVMDRDVRHTLLAEAYEQSDHLLSQVENQLLIAQLERWSFEPKPASMGLPRVLERVLTVLRHRYGDRVDVVDVRVSPELPDAYCQPTHLDLVLSNLLGNALEYTRARRVRVEAVAEAGWLEVTVSDDGGGLPRERRGNVFSKTAPAGQNRARGGLGLGLYQCRLVVERSFGGRIWLAGTGSEGTTFKFTVPAAATQSRPRVARGRRAG
jgi:PAS domain S-box-containing protein